MSLNSHLNWDIYRRDARDAVDENPDLAIALVKRDFVGLVDTAPDELRDRIRYDLASATIKDHEWKFIKDDEAGIVEDMQNNPPHSVEIIRDLEAEDLDTSFIGYYDTKEMNVIADEGLGSRIDSYNESGSDRPEYKKRTIVFPNPALALIWMDEITGQISDGAWENDRRTQHDRWKDWCYAKVELDMDADEVELQGPELTNMCFDRRGKLGEYEALLVRMIFMVRASGIYEDYTMDDLSSDLKTLNRGL